MTNQEAIEKFKKIKRGNICLIHLRIEGKEVIDDYSLCDMAISALQALDEIYAFIMKSEASETTDGVLEIFDALEAHGLKQEAKNSSDLISRQAAIKIIKNYCENGCDIAEDNWCPSCQREQFIKLLEALPSAQPDVPDINVGNMISREELFEELNCINLPVGNEAVDKIFSVIENMPSAQPEIIRCRDCIHAIEDALCGGYWCKGKAVKSSHYCGYAERRTDGKN